MTDLNKPFDILEKAIGEGILRNKLNKYKKPGSIIEKLSEEDREILKQLKSDDIKTIRKDLIG
jgi:hypothetical protein